MNGPPANVSALEAEGIHPLYACSPSARKMVLIVEDDHALTPDEEATIVRDWGYLLYKSENLEALAVQIDRMTTLCAGAVKAWRPPRSTLRDLWGSNPALRLYSVQPECMVALAASCSRRRKPLYR